jgi:hypothetical protein
METKKPKIPYLPDRSILSSDCGGVLRDYFALSLYGVILRSLSLRSNAAAEL